MPIFKSVKRAIKHGYDVSYLPKKLRNNKTFMEQFHPPVRIQKIVRPKLEDYPDAFSAALDFIDRGYEEEAEEVIKSNPEILHMKDDEGRLLSHIAAMRARTGTLDVIHKYAPETIYMEDKYGNVPAHLVHMCFNGHPEYTMEWFAKNTPEIIFAQNKDRRSVINAWTREDTNSPYQTAYKYINGAKEKLEEIKKIEEEKRLQAEKAEQERIKLAEQKRLAEIKEEKKKQRIEKANKNKQEIAEIAEMLLSTPQSLPEKLFDNSNENNKKLDKALDEVRKQLSEGYNSIRSQPSEAKKYVKQCQTKINRISRIITSKKTNTANSIKQNDSTLDNIIRAI